MPGQEPDSVHGIAIGREKLHNKYAEEPTLGTVSATGEASSLRFRLRQKQ